MGLTNMLNNETVERMNEFLLDQNPFERIEWANTVSQGNFIVTTSGSRTSRIMPSLIKKTLGGYKPMVFIDTGFYPIETYKFIKKMHDDGIYIHCYGSKMSRDLIELMFNGIPEFGSERWGDFINIIKNKPLELALRELRPVVRLRGIMHWQTEERRQKKILEYKKNVYHFHPILEWTREDAERYIQENHLLVNEFHYDITKGQTPKNQPLSYNLDCFNGEGI
jgi:3'-phosphoadenosine 5'-phosphosulfate sulfotransferase (PAPS reductase)/FAD synthetase